MGDNTCLYRKPHPCPYRKPHPALKYLRLEGSSAILLDRPAHPFSMVCFTFIALVSALFWLIRSLIAPRTSLVAENLALRQQLAVLNRKIHRPQLHRRDRFFWGSLRACGSFKSIISKVSPG
jgi:hypothetical protein